MRAGWAEKPEDMQTLTWGRYQRSPPPPPPDKGGGGGGGGGDGGVFNIGDLDLCICVGGIAQGMFNAHS